MNLPESEQQRLKAVIARNLGLAPEAIDLGKPRDHYPTWNSLKHLELMMATEKEFGIRFTSIQLVHAIEPKQVENLVAKCLTEK